MVEASSVGHTKSGSASDGVNDAGRGYAGSRAARKSPTAYRTISEVSDELEVPQHVLRFWETKFSQVRPLKRGGGRRYYRPEDITLLRRIQALLYKEGYTIKGVQKLLKEGRAAERAKAVLKEDEKTSTHHAPAKETSHSAQSDAANEAEPSDSAPAQPDLAESGEHTAPSDRAGAPDGPAVRMDVTQEQSDREHPETVIDGAEDSHARIFHPDAANHSSDRGAHSWPEGHVSGPVRAELEGILETLRTVRRALDAVSPEAENLPPRQGMGATDTVAHQRLADPKTDDLS